MKKLYSASNKLTAIGMGEKKPSGQKTDAEVSKSGSMEDTKVKNFHHSLSHYGSGDFLPKFSATNPLILLSSCLSKYPNTYFHMNKMERQVFSNKEISSEDEDASFLPGDLQVHSSPMVQTPQLYYTSKD